MRNKTEDVGRLHKKIDNLQQLSNIVNISAISDNIQSWCLDRPENKQLSDFRSTWLKVVLYINKLEMDRDSYAIAYSQLMEAKNKEINRLGDLLAKVVDENIDLDEDIMR